MACATEKHAMTKRILFLNPPSYEGFDGGAGSRYQAKREVRSFWYPTWLAQAAAFFPDSRLLDAPVENMSMEDTVRAAEGFEVIVIYTSTPGFYNDAELAQRLKEAYPEAILTMVGPHCTALPEKTLRSCRALNFVVRGEFDCTLVDIANQKPLAEVEGISYLNHDHIVHNEDRPLIQDMDSLPSVLDVYRRDLNIEKYFVGYLLHPYLSFYTGRGCPGRCTFCLWPQTIGGRDYRTRSPQNVLDEMKRAKDMFPQVKEFFFDDDTFTAKPQRAEQIAVGLGKLGVTWSCSARANLGEKTLRIMKDGGLRCVMVGIESGSDRILRNIHKGITTSQARTFMETCRRLEIVTHATFMVGLPGETKETIKQSIKYAKELDSDTIQVSIATPYPGTELYRQALENGWLTASDLVSLSGVQQVAIQYDDLTGQDIFDAVETFYNRFYFRPKPVMRMLRTMMKDKDICIRRLREAKEFFSFMHNRKRAGRAS
jgi:hopanoid biosynthesis associated radical SAM protein HpnJ